MTIHVVPPVAGEQRLIEEGAVGAQEGAALVALASIVAHVVRLAAGLRVSVHSRHGGHVVAREGGVRDRVVDGVVVARRSGNVLKVLLVLPSRLLLLVPITAADNDGSVVVVDLLVLRRGVLSDRCWCLVVLQLRLLNRI